MSNFALKKIFFGRKFQECQKNTYICLVFFNGVFKFFKHGGLFAQICSFSALMMFKTVKSGKNCQNLNLNRHFEKIQNGGQFYDFLIEVKIVKFFKNANFVSPQLYLKCLNIGNLVQKSPVTSIGQLTIPKYTFCCAGHLKCTLYRFKPIVLTVVVTLPPKQETFYSI